MNDLVLYRPQYQYIAPSSGIADDAAYLIAEAQRRAREGVATERDTQVNGAVDAAMARLSQRAPQLAAPIIAQGQAAALATSRQAMDEATRRAATILLQAEPYLAERVIALSRGAGAAGTQSGLATFASEAWPYAAAALVVGVFAYGFATEWGKK